MKPGAAVSIPLPGMVIELVREVLKEAGLIVPVHKAVRKTREVGLDVLPVG